jgi:type II secretory pathway predicted ATPase ExeA
VRSTIDNAHRGLRETPFGLTPDPQFFYFNTVYREALAALADGFASRKGLIVVTGEPGTGKTTLLRQLVRGLEPKFKTAYIFNTRVSFTNLLHLILTELGLRGFAEDKLEMIDRLNDYLLEQDRKGHIVVLLIDEAQDLSRQILEELRLLTNLETDQKKLLQIALIGQPELQRKLDEPGLWQLNQRVARHCRLAPLAANEVGSYMDARLHAVAQRRKELFDRDAVKKIGLYSNGIPRLINIICNNALLISDAAAQSKIDEQMIDEVAADLLLDQSGGRLGFAPPRIQRPLAGNDFLDSRQENTADHTTAENPFHNQKTLSWLTISPLLIVILIGLGGFLYSQKTNDIDYAKLSGAALQENSSNLQSQIRIPISHNPQPFSADQNLSIAALRTMTIVPAADQHLSRQEIEKFPANTGNEKQSEHRQPTHDKAESDPLDNFEVVGPSFVRNQPSSNADIIATLEPGTQVIVTRRNGDYYAVRSVGIEPIRGYVHREDAFFERSRLPLLSSDSWKFNH